jgi:hypothetical protein
LILFDFSTFGFPGKTFLLLARNMHKVILG